MAQPQTAPATLPANFSAWDAPKAPTAPPASLPANFSAWDDAAPPQTPGFWDVLKREGKSLEGTISGMPSAVYHAFSEPATQEEKEKFGGEQEVTGAKRVGLGLHRLLTAPVENAVDWYSAAAKGKIPNAYDQALSVLPEAVGTAGGSVIAAKGTESAIQNAPAIADMIRNAPSTVSDAASAAATRMSAAAKAVLRKGGSMATAAGESLDPDVVGLASPRAAHVLRLAQKVGKVATKYGAELPDATAENKPFAGESEPPAENYGHVAEVLLGKERANAPIFQKAASLNEAANSVAEVIAKDRTAQQAEALGKLPAPNSDVTAEQSAALGKIPAVTDADRAAAQSLVKDALDQHTSDVIENAIPKDTEQRAQTKSAVEYYLRRADVEGAERALDKGAKTQNPAWQPLERKPVPSTNEIRARVQADATAPKPGSAADTAEDRALQQEMNWDLQRHGWAAESEARREFIARNSTGMTKGELAKRFAGSRSGTGGQTSVAPTSVAGTSTDDLTSILQQSLDAVRKQRTNSR